MSRTRLSRLFSSVSCTKRPHGIFSIALTRPQLHNAFNASVIHDLFSAFSAIPQDTRLVLLESQGKTFSAGADLAWMRDMGQLSQEENQADAEKLFDMFFAIKNCPVPTIARVQGSALGGGAGLIAACDLAVGVKSAWVGFTEVKLGIIPAVISPFVLEKVGPGHAAALFLTGQRISAQRAGEMGLLSEVVDDEAALDVAVDRLSREVLSSGPEAVKAAKSLIRELTKPAWLTQKDFVCSEIARLRVSPEGQHGLQSFLNKEKPEWINKTN